jgi:hypothetical protein
MDLSGSYTFNAPPARVWDLLMSPDAIASCLPGCDRFEPDGPDRYRARMSVALGAIMGSYEGVVTLSDKVPLTSYRLTGEGQGRPGFVSGTSTVTLRADGDRTVVEVSATVQTGGTIARAGHRIIGSVSKLMLDRLFGCLAAKV